ncbi:class I SAM-dependent methyltransferase [Roseobacteraceae bacterium NS-SX3]
MQNTAPFWDGIAEKYARNPIKDMESYEYTLERTASYLSPEDRVLELGCGTGTTALRLAGGVAEICATDISPGMLAVGKRRAAEQGAENVRFAEATAATAPGAPYDAVMAFNVLHLVDDLERTLAEVHGLLRPGGMFISKTFCVPQAKASLKYRFIRLVLPLMQMAGKAPYVRFLREAELDRMVTAAGFGIVESGSFPARDGRRFLAARRR